MVSIPLDAADVTTLTQKTLHVYSLPCSIFKHILYKTLPPRKIESDQNVHFLAYLILSELRIGVSLIPRVISLYHSEPLLRKTHCHVIESFLIIWELFLGFRFSEGKINFVISTRGKKKRSSAFSLAKTIYWIAMHSFTTKLALNSLSPKKKNQSL